jgi:hypothetical protein
LPSSGSFLGPNTSKAILTMTNKCNSRRIASTANSTLPHAVITMTSSVLQTQEEICLKDCFSRCNLRGTVAANSRSQLVRSSIDGTVSCGINPATAKLSSRPSGVALKTIVSREVNLWWAVGDVEPDVSRPK